MSDIESNFWQFHNANPEIFKMICRFAREIKGSGIRHYGIGAIFERMRWHFLVEQKNREFKLNNNYRSRYVRLLETTYPDEFRDFFNKREMKTSTEFKH
jgi:hypothetical protein